MRSLSWILSLSALVLCSCAPSGAAARAEADLLRLQSLQRRAHLEKDAALLTSIFADGFLSVHDGTINRPTEEESRARFASYFDRVDFLAWEDITPPLIRVSRDGSMAYVLVHKRVHVRSRSTGEESETVFAWVETYEKVEREWRLMLVVSTDRPSGIDQPGG